MATKEANQTYFDSVVTHLMNQTHAAVGLSGVCVYYEPGTGNRCAVGQALPLQLAAALSKESFIEETGGGWPDVCCSAWENEVARLAVEHLENVSKDLLVHTQYVHDHKEWYGRTDDNKIDMLIKLKHIAYQYGLEWK